MSKLNAVIGGVVFLAIWTWGAMEYRESQLKAEASEQNRTVERTAQGAANDIATAWHLSNIEREKTNAQKDKEIKQLRAELDKRPALADHPDGSGPDYYLYRMHNIVSLCRVPEGQTGLSPDNYADGSDVLRYTSDEYQAIRSQLETCITTLKALPCTEY